MTRIVIMIVMSCVVMMWCGFVPPNWRRPYRLTAAGAAAAHPAALPRGLD
jgi:hypothetical protein